jgi:hypothetical protein
VETSWPTNLLRNGTGTPWSKTWVPGLATHKMGQAHLIRLARLQRVGAAPRLESRELRRCRTSLSMRCASTFHLIIWFGFDS